jgi:hypothetical protein
MKPVPGTERHGGKSLGDDTGQFALVVAARVIDEAGHDEDGVEGELGSAWSFGAEEDDRAAAEMAQLGWAAPGVLEAAGVVEAIAEDERVGVVETAVRGLVGPEGAMVPAWSIRNAVADRLVPAKPSPAALKNPHAPIFLPFGTCHFVGRDVRIVRVAFASSVLPCVSFYSISLLGSQQDTGWVSARRGVCQRDTRPGKRERSSGALGTSTGDLQAGHPVTATITSRIGMVQYAGCRDRWPALAVR